MPVLSDAIRERIRAYIPRYPHKQAVTLPALHLVHDELRTVSNEAMVEIAELLDLHPAEVRDTMTFYAFFKGEGAKLGRTRLWVCRGLACMLRGAYELIEHCEAKLGIPCGQTTPDGKITLEFAECIGACDGAPACMRDDRHVMDVTPEKADTLIEELRRGDSTCRLTNPCCSPASASPTATSWRATAPTAGIPPWNACSRRCSPRRWSRR